MRKRWRRCPRRVSGLARAAGGCAFGGFCTPCPPFAVGSPRALHLPDPAARRAPAVRPPGLPRPTLQLGQVGGWGGGSGGSGDGDPRPRCTGSRWPGCSPLMVCTLGRGGDRACQGYSNSEASRAAAQGGVLSLQDPETPQALLPAGSGRAPERGLPRTRWALSGNILGAPGRRLGVPGMPGACAVPMATVQPGPTPPRAAGPAVASPGPSFVVCNRSHSVRPG